MSVPRPITFFNSTTQTAVVKENQQLMTWEDMIPLFTTKVISESKESAQLFVAAKMKENGKRCGEDVEFYSAIVLDYDSGTHQNYFMQFHEKLEYCLYTSFSNSKEKPKFRVVIPLKHRMPVEKYREYKISLGKYFCSGMDPASFSISQAFFLPNVPAERAELFYSVHHPGELFDADVEMSEHARLSRIKAELLKRKAMLRSKDGQDVSLDEAAREIFEIDPDCPYKTWLGVGMFLRGHYGEHGREILKTWSDGCTRDDHQYRIKECDKRFDKYADNDFRIGVGSIIYAKRTYPKGF